MICEDQLLRLQSLRLGLRLGTGQLEILQAMQAMLVGGKKHKLSSQPVLGEALLSLLPGELLRLYSDSIQHLLRGRKFQVKISSESSEYQAFSMNSIGLWKARKIVVDHGKGAVLVRRSKSNRVIEMAQCLVRLSKNAGRSALCLVNYRVEAEQYHLGFSSPERRHQVYEQLYQLSLQRWLFFISHLDGASGFARPLTSDRPIFIIPELAHSPKSTAQNIQPKNIQTLQLGKDLFTRKKTEQRQTLKIAVHPEKGQFQKCLAQIEEPKRAQPKREQQAVLQTLFRDSVNQDAGRIKAGDSSVQGVHQQATQPTHKPFDYLSHLGRFCPKISSCQLDAEQDYFQLHVQKDIRVMAHSGEFGRYKLVLGLQHPQRAVFQGLCDPLLLPRYHPDVTKVQLISFISSQNLGLFYVKLKPFGQSYLPRDFLLTRQVSGCGQLGIVADCEGSSASHPSGFTTVRARLEESLIRVKKVEDRSLACVEMLFYNNGLLTEHQQREMTTRFLLGFRQLGVWLRQGEKPGSRLFEVDWRGGQGDH